MTQFIKCEATNINKLFEDNRFAISEKLRDNLNWDKIFSAIISYQYTYNGHMMRWAKSDLISKGIQRWSNGYLTYIDGTGHDFLTADGYKLELKCGLLMFQKKTKNTNEITVKNMNGSVADLTKYEKTFDFLLIVEPGLAGLTDWETAEPYFRENSDTIKLKLESRHIEFIKQIHTIKDTKQNLADRYDEATEKALDDIDKAFE